MPARLTLLPPRPPCRYSDEELRALQQQPEGQQQPAETQQAVQPAAAAAAAAPVDPAALKKQLLQLIPKDRAGVFGYPIEWAVLDAAPAVRDKISGEAAGSVAGGWLAANRPGCGVRAQEGAGGGHCACSVQ